MTQEPRNKVVDVRRFGAVVAALWLAACGDDGSPPANTNTNDNQAQAVCGNGLVEGAETCDDGQANSDVEPDACRTSCQAASCGDGVLDTGEDCDEGAGNSDDPNRDCRTTCRIAGCGDGITDDRRGEECDDANLALGDGCEAACLDTRFRDLWGSGPDDIHAVGTKGALQHFAGGVWGGTPWENCPDDLEYVAGCSPTEVYAGTVTGMWGIQLLRFDGSTWSLFSPAPYHWIFRLWCAAPGELFAASESGYVLHFADGAWTREDTGIIGYLYAIWGSGPDDVFAAGEDGIGTGEQVVHWDGASWTIMSTPVTTVLYALWGSGPDDVFAAGDLNRVIHYDGVAWSQLTTGFEAEGDHISGLWGTGTGTVYAITNVSGSLLVFDGSTWSMVATGLPALNAIWGSAENDVHLAADGALLHWDGQSVTPLLGR